MLPVVVAAVIGGGDGGGSCDSAKMEVMERYVRYCVMVFTVFQFLLLILLCSLIRFFITILQNQNWIDVVQPIE